MKRMIVICEGPTEQEFCKDVLTNYFITKNISIECPTIKHSNGGIVSWNTLKKQIIMHLNEGDCFVTLLIDYYRIKDSYSRILIISQGGLNAKTLQIFMTRCISCSTKCHLI